jgi:hypothetical protein
MRWNHACASTHDLIGVNIKIQKAVGVQFELWPLQNHGVILNVAVFQAQ